MARALAQTLHRLAAIALVGIIGLAGGRLAAAETLPVVTSFSILGDLTKQVGGDRVEVHSLVGPGADAHVYQPTPGDARLLARAKLVIVNGLGFEGWIARLIQSSGYRGGVIVASQGVETLRLAGADADRHAQHGEVDPHAWQDLANARRYVANIATALADADPANRAYYQANASRLERQIGTLDAELRSTFGSLPAARRKVVTSHDAFAYFGRAYGIRFLAPVGVSSDAEPTAREVGALIRQIRREAIRAMFIESIADPRLLERISRESGVRIGGTLYSDSLSQPGTPADTYLGMVRHNAKTLSAALAD
ncbi:MAG TPA: metal ABC transporter substrate-binding protein [Accumulibacter sp.]|uniref:metal ABC transporter substrate-binding protein n=1 Tax=Accumulibacter sp. TaxID=2053492 RepID=UPI0025EBD25B|nr:metal ABC transporter substrate-binding protein [Accumulibacter sp.]MCM8599434.1 metal ABC transporter substrate-binding protein [Accumulibacter sp.]MCM8663567.1 metal ABC transporter substrate-binding protein [Accumulibacter sp.]HNC52851.1 metal ABC transporter substrate-binding protein [Accumulibacter sp.]